MAASSLPAELIHEILKSAIESSYEHLRYTEGILPAAAAVSDLLLSASLVHPSWRAQAQPMLLRNASVTPSSHTRYLDRVQNAGQGFAESIRSVRLVGPVPFATMQDFIDQEDYGGLVVATTRMSSLVASSLPRLELAELVQMVVEATSPLTRQCWSNHSPRHALTWASEVPHITLVDSFALSPIEARPFIQRLTSSPMRYSVQCSSEEGNLICGSATYPAFALRRLWLDDIGIGLHVVLSHRGPDTDQLMELGITSVLRPLLFSISLPSLWLRVPSIRKLVAPFQILCYIEGGLYPPPPTLNILKPIPFTPIPHSAPLSEMAPTRFAGQSLDEARAILLEAIKDMPALEELVVEDDLRTEVLEKECATRGIKLGRIRP